MDWQTVREKYPHCWIVIEALDAFTDGKNRILDIQPQSLHQRTPFYVGSKKMVEKAESY